MDQQTDPRAGVERLTAAIGLLSGLAALILRLRAPELVDWLARLSAGGVLAAAAIAILVLVARRVYARFRPLGFLVPVLLILNALSVIFDLPRLLIETAGPTHVPPVAETVAEGALAVLSAVLVAKVLLLHRYAGAAYPLPTPTSPPLLPSQRHDLAELERLIENGMVSGGKVIPIMGNQGQGKSFLVHHLSTAWSRDPARPVVAYVDVWQQQTEVDLQVSIIESLLRQPKTLRGLRWLSRVPVTFLFARSIAHLQNSASVLKIKLEGKSAGALEADLRPPRLNWQRLYERISSGSKSVVILDEVDRSVPEVAQAALTLARRSVDIPGVTVLLPYIRELVRYKVFNPAGPVLPDLATSMEAVLFTRLPLGPTTSSAGSGTAERSEALRSRLVDGFLSASADDRDFYQGVFEEKYLGPEGIRIHHLTPADVCSMLLTFDTLRTSVLGMTGREASGVSALTSAMTPVLERGFRQHRLSLGIPSLRGLQGHLHAVVTAAAREAAARDRVLSPESVATLALIALDHSALYYRVLLENR
jgi:hypothetical protein